MESIELPKLYRIALERPISDQLPTTPAQIHTACKCRTCFALKDDRVIIWVIYQGIVLVVALSTIAIFIIINIQFHPILLLYLPLLFLIVGTNILPKYLRLKKRKREGRLIIGPQGIYLREWVINYRYQANPSLPYSNLLMLRKKPMQDPFYPPLKRLVETFLPWSQISTIWDHLVMNCSGGFLRDRSWPMLEIDSLHAPQGEALSLLRKRGKRSALLNRGWVKWETCLQVQDQSLVLYIQPDNYSTGISDYAEAGTLLSRLLRMYWNAFKQDTSQFKGI